MSNTTQPTPFDQILNGANQSPQPDTSPATPTPGPTPFDKMLDAAVTPPAANQKLPATPFDNILDHAVNPPSSSPSRQTPYDGIISKLEDKYNLPAGLFHRLIDAESSFNTKSLSPTGAMGLTQLEPETAKSLGVQNPWDPAQNLEGGAKYLRQMLDQFGYDPAKALAAYNAGPGAVRRFGGVPPFAETQNYVHKILNGYKVPMLWNPSGKIDQDIQVKDADTGKITDYPSGQGPTTLTPQQVQWSDAAIHQQNVLRNLSNASVDPEKFILAVRNGQKWVEPKGGSTGVGDLIDIQQAAHQMSNALGYPDWDSQMRPTNAAQNLLDPRSNAFQNLKRVFANPAGITPDTEQAKLEQGIDQGHGAYAKPFQDASSDRIKGILRNFGGTAMADDTPLQTFGRAAMAASSPSRIARTLVGDPRADSSLGTGAANTFAATDLATWMMGGGGLGSAAEAAASLAKQYAPEQAAKILTGNLIKQGLADHAATFLANQLAIQAPAIAVRAGDLQKSGISQVDAWKQSAIEAGHGLLSTFDPRTPFNSSLSGPERLNAAAMQLATLLTGGEVAREGLGAYNEARDVDRYSQIQPPVKPLATEAAQSQPLPFHFNTQTDPQTALTQLSAALHRYGLNEQEVNQHVNELAPIVHDAQSEGTQVSPGWLASQVPALQDAMRGARLPEDQRAALSAAMNPVLEFGQSVNNPLGGAKSVEQINPGILAQEYAAPFYSKLEQVVSDKVPNSGSAEQVKATLLANGVKPDELQYTGVGPMLDALGKQPIAKQDLLTHLQDSQVPIKEIWHQAEPTLDDIGTHEQRFARVSALAPDYVNSVEQSREHDFNLENEYNDYSGLPLISWGDYMAKHPVEPEVESMMHQAADDPDTFHAELNQLKSDPTIYGEYTLPGGSNYRELLLTRSPNSSDDTYTSSHWEEPNILAHARMDDRTGSNGEKILHVAEIQSDWHQEGRKTGYKQDANTDGVPDAPFKKTWHELAMKRILRYAAENGYDKVTWDTGQTSADRYDLSKHVNEIRYNPDLKGESPNFHALNRIGVNVIRGNYPPDKLADVIGKEVAQRLMATTPREFGDGNYHILKGVDLKVGGEGMKGFYDKILPEFVSKYTKKWGGKVEPDSLNSNPVHSIALTPELKNAVLNDGQPLFQRGASSAIKGAYDPASKVIQLAQGKADLSTVVHEVGHYFHDVLLDHPEYGKVIRKTYGDLTDLKGAERFARHFENYLRNGIAPNSGLKTVFAAIKEWMQGIYSKWKYGKASPNVKAIFDKVYEKPSAETLKLANEFDQKWNPDERTALLKLRDDDPRLDRFDDQYDPRIHKALVYHFGESTDNVGNTYPADLLRKGQESAANENIAHESPPESWEHIKDLNRLAPTRQMRRWYQNKSGEWLPDMRQLASIRNIGEAPEWIQRMVLDYRDNKISDNVVYADRRYDNGLWGVRASKPPPGSLRPDELPYMETTTPGNDGGHSVWVPNGTLLRFIQDSKPEDYQAVKIGTGLSDAELEAVIRHYGDTGTNHSEIESRGTDADIQPSAVPVRESEAQPASERKSENKPELDSTPNVTGIRKAETEAHAKSMGIPLQDKQAYVTPSMAHERGIQSTVDPMALAREILNKPRQLTPEEVGVLANKHNDLVKGERDLMSQMKGMVPSSEMFKMRSAQLRNALDDHAQVLNASRLAGREASAGLQSFKIMTNIDDGSYAGAVRLAEALKGDKLSPKEETRIRALQSELDKATQGYTDLMRRYQAKSDQLAEALAKQKLEAEQKATYRAQTKSSIRQREKDAVARMLKAVQSAPVGSSPFEAIPEFMAGLKDLAIAAVHDGANTLEEVYERVQNSLKQTGIEVSRAHVNAALAGMYEHEAATPSEAQLKLRELRKQAGAQTKIAKLEDQLKNNDFQPAKAKTKPEITPELQRLIDRKTHLEAHRAQLIRSMRKPTFWDTLMRIRRASMLSGLGIGAKIVGTSGGYMAATSVEDLVGGLWGNARPNLQKVAPSEAKFDPQAYAAGTIDLFHSITDGDTWNKFKTGIGKLEAEQNQRNPTIAGIHAERPDMLNFFQRIHGALHTPVQRYAYTTEATKLTTILARQGVDVQDPKVIDAINTQAYIKSKEAALLNDNAATNAIQRMFGSFGQTGRHIGNYLVPFAKVGANVAGRTGEYFAGIPYGASKEIASKLSGSKLTHEESGAILRAYKRGTVGAGLIALGYVLAGNGTLKGAGLYDPMRKKSPDGQSYGDLTIGGWKVPQGMTENPIVAMLQIGLTIHQIKKFHQGLFEGASRIVTGLAEKIPGVGELENDVDLLKNPNKLPTAAGRAVASNVPAILGDIARAIDKTPSGEVRKVDQTGFSHPILALVPTYRNKLPTKR